MEVAVLFARRDSVYKSLLDVDVYDEDRDARTYAGGHPVISHPPCRAWGRLRHFAKPLPHERSLAFFAVDAVRKFGGVLEHPAFSTLWPAYGLPLPGQRDAFGGWTLPIVQYWWGHPCEKSTWLYIVGVEPRDVPPMPLQLGEAPFVIGTNSRRPGVRPSVPDRRWRERTPPALAEWLVELARMAAR